MYDIPNGWSSSVDKATIKIFLNACNTPEVLELSQVAYSSEEFSTHICELRKSI
jgi:hypothetical protein